jgi:hypothetical protein
VGCTIEHYIFHLIEMKATERWQELYEEDPHFWDDALRDVEADTLRFVIGLHQKAWEHAYDVLPTALDLLAQEEDDEETIVLVPPAPGRARPLSCRP